MDSPISHEQKERSGTFYIEENGARVAELTYSRSHPSTIVVGHVGVNPVLEGKGVGRSLVNAAVVWARENQVKIVPVCPFAVAMFKRDPSIRDVQGTPG